MKRYVRGAIASQLVMDEVKNGDVFDVPAGMKIDSIAVINKSGIAGNINLGDFTAGSGGSFEVQRLDITQGAVGTVEVRELTVSTGATSAGNVDIVLDGADAVTVALAETDTTAELVAAAIAAAEFIGWTVTAEGAVVTFTRDTGIASTGAYTFTDTGSTGAAATFAEITAGADGSGTVSVVLDGASAVETVLAAGDSAEAVATKIGAGTYTGWSAVVDGASVTFTRAAAVKSTGAYTFAIVSGAENVAGAFTEVVAGSTAASGSIGEQLVEAEALTETANTGKGLTIVESGSLFITGKKVGIGISSAAVVKLSVGMRQLF